MMFGQKKKSRIIDVVTPNFSNFTEEELADMSRCFTGEITKEELEESDRESEAEEDRIYWELKDQVETGRWWNGSLIFSDDMVGIKESYEFHRDARMKEGKPV